MNNLLFSLKTYRISLLVVVSLLLITCYHRTEHFDDAWFAEQSYWLTKDGWVRSELFRGMHGWENRIYVFHKLFIYAGAMVMGLFGFSLPVSKLLTTLCAGLSGYLIWQYTSRASKEQQWLAVILFFGCGTLIRYFSVNRPEIMCMMLGFGSYLAIDQSGDKPPKSLLGGIFAGLAALTHLNGLIYLFAGVVWLFIRTGWKSTIWFSLAGAVTLALYGLDAFADGHLTIMLDQFINDPATQSNFRLSDKLMVMVNYHQLFFHSHGEVPLTVLTLLCLLVFRRFIKLSDPVLLYLTLLFISFWVLTKSNFDFYYILFLPWLVLTVSTSLVTFLPGQPSWKQKTGKALLIGYYGLSLFSIGKVLIENYKTPYVPAYNAFLAQQMPYRHTRIIAPISFFFGQMDNYNIHGLSYYSDLHNRTPLPLERFFQLAHSDNVKYVVSDGYLTASYFIPLNAPARIGSYKRIFQDEMTSIYEHQ